MVERNSFKSSVSEDQIPLMYVFIFHLTFILIVQMAIFLSLFFFSTFIPTRSANHNSQSSKEETNGKKLNARSFFYVHNENIPNHAYLNANSKRYTSTALL